MLGLPAVEITIMIKGLDPWHINKGFSQDVDKRKEAAQPGPARVIHKTILNGLQSFTKARNLFLSLTLGAQNSNTCHTATERNESAFSRERL